MSSVTHRAGGLRERLIGAWKLVSYEERPADGSTSIYPLGEQPQGLIMYTPDGYMSAQLMRRERKPFAGGDWFDGTPNEYREEGTSYIAYSGRFVVDEDNESLTHSMFVSLFPNWLGNTQPRVVRMEGDRLQLRTASPFPSGGHTVMSYITWQRAEPN
jgi:hypothetical protein